MLDAPQQLETWKAAEFVEFCNCFCFFFKEPQLLSNYEAGASSISYAANLAWQPS